LDREKQAVDRSRAGRVLQAVLHVVMTVKQPKTNFARDLLGWYDREHRDLPWRREPSAYRTLVSELMLQQTVVATVVPYFERFLARFPTIKDLAAAKEDEVMALWSGLGYYRRARHLQQAARLVVEEMKGELPTREQALRALPGIGEYTAAAVAAIAFGQVTLPLDGNVARVLARLMGDCAPIDQPITRARLRAQGQILVPLDRPGDFAQAMMELGALCCTPRSPACARCPVARHCQARTQGTAETIPVRAKRTAKQRLDLVAVAVKRRGRLLVQQRPDSGLLAKTWALPLHTLAGHTSAQAAHATLTELGLNLEGVPVSLGEIRHVFTHRDATVQVLGARASGRVSRANVRWIYPHELNALPLSSFGKKMIERAFQNTG
jgi:A/G-specific adenine glycosylase